MTKLSRNVQKLKLFSGLLVIALMLGACGDTTPAKPTDDTQSNEWDNMKWDQSTWG
ncbi:MAG: hypothetical protein GY746_12615 [Gammaproteobacteria bacterium]|nr:hypothetical protein [Gammaproteobacteria bacterium]